MKETTKGTISDEVEAFVRRTLEAHSKGRQLTGSFKIEVHLSQSGLSGMEASFTERIK